MHIKRFNNFHKINETIYKDYLYHGSPYLFFEFKNQTTYFSETEEFAVDYTNQKSFDQGMDAEPKLYVVKAKTDFFDITDKNHEKAIRKILPSKIKYSYNNFGFDAEVDKEEFILNMKGFYTLEPFDDALNAKIGDIIPSPMYHGDTLKVYKKDDKYAYTYDNKNVVREMDTKKILNGYEPKYKPLRKFVEDYAKEMEPDKKYFMDNNLWYYFTVLASPKQAKNLGLQEPPNEIVEEFHRLYDELKNTIVQDLINNNRIRKFNLTTVVKKSIDTWRHYENETILNAIGKLGFGGYIAQEDNIKTFAVFNPKKDVEIVKYEIPHGREFSSEEDYKEFYNFDKEIAAYLKSNKELKDKWYIYVDMYTIYKHWKEGKTPKESYNILSKKANS